jgi:hypothetical protein
MHLHTPDRETLTLSPAQSALFGGHGPELRGSEVQVGLYFGSRILVPQSRQSPHFMESVCPYFRELHFHAIE